MSRCIYIAGPMDGINDYEANFQAAQKHLESDGWLVENPVVIADVVRNRFKDVYVNKEIPYKKFFEADVNTLLTCDAIFMLKGWECSKGARAEHANAVAMGLDIYYENELKTYRY